MDLFVGRVVYEVCSYVSVKVSIRVLIVLCSDVAFSHIKTHNFWTGCFSAHMNTEGIP